MLEYLTQLPCETLGLNILGFLELVDIIQWENAATSQKSQQLLREILPYCPPIIVSNSWNRVKFNHRVCNWFNTRRCRVQFMKIPIESLREVNFENDVLYDSTLCLKETASLKDIELLNDLNIRDKITKLDIGGNQYPAVMVELFSLLNNSSVCSLDIQSLNLSQWVEQIKKMAPCLRVRSLIIESSNVSQRMKHIKKIGSGLRELIIINSFIRLTDLNTITEYCPYLEKLSLSFQVGVSGSSNILQNSTETEADLTAFAEKSPQLEELSLTCPKLTDQSVIALAQHCSRLKKLKLQYYKLTAASLIALSERGLPLEELDIPWIPIPSAEIAAQCAHALSCIRQLSTHRINGSVIDMRYAIQYMTGLRLLTLDSAEDHLLVPHLLLLLQGQCCAGLESLSIWPHSSITPQQLCELATVSVQLCTLAIYKTTCSSDAVLVELALSCPHLLKVSLSNHSEVTEKGVLALAAHCRQLREIHIPIIIVTQETVKQLAQHCRRLTKLHVWKEVIMAQHYGHYKQYYSKEIRALRENTTSKAPSPPHIWLGGDSHNYTLYTQNILGICALLVVVYAYMVYKL